MGYIFFCLSYRQTVECPRQTAPDLTTHILQLLLSVQKRFRTSMASAADPASPDPPFSRKRAVDGSVVRAQETPNKTLRSTGPEEERWIPFQPKLKAPEPPSSGVITFPRTAVGLNTYYKAISRDFPEAVRETLSIPRLGSPQSSARTSTSHHGPQFRCSRKKKGLILMPARPNSLR